jgi:hypothetical protein
MKSVANYLALVCGWALLTSEIRAQYPGAPAGGFGAGRPPAISPYLNLTRGGDAAVNYYGLVRPQFANNRALQGLGSEINYLEASSGQQVEQTGHGASFMTHYQYFMNNGRPSAYNQASYRPGATQGGSSVAPSRSR